MIENTIKAFCNIEDYENCYIFSPSISRRKAIGGKTYLVRSYFKGGKDFEKTMQNLAVKNTNNVR